MRPRTNGEAYGPESRVLDVKCKNVVCFVSVLKTKRDNFKVGNRYNLEGKIDSVITAETMRCEDLRRLVEQNILNAFSV